MPHRRRRPPRGAPQHPNCADGHAELVAWAQSVGVGRVGIEGSGNYGRPAAQALIAAAVSVVEVPPQMTAAARRGRRTATKSDRIDALEIARITARDHDLPAPRFVGAPENLACVVNYRRVVCTGFRAVGIVESRACRPPGVHRADEASG